MGQKGTAAEGAEDRESSRKQAGGKEGREESLGWVEMEEMLSSKRSSKACGPEGELSQGHCEFMWLIKQKSSKTS